MSTVVEESTGRSANIGEETADGYTEDAIPVYNSYYNKYCAKLYNQNTFPPSVCSPITAFTSTADIRYYSVIVYCDDDSNAWKMSIYAFNSNCHGNQFLTNVTGYNTGCTYFTESGYTFYTETMCHKTPSPTIAPSTASPTAAPSYAANEDGKLTLYNDYKCSATSFGQYLQMPMEDFTCVPAIVNGYQMNVGLTCPFGTNNPMSVQLYNPSNCSATSLIDQVYFDDQNKCQMTAYYYNNTWTYFSFTAACGKNLIEDDCQTVFNGVLLQSYSLLFFNAVLFSLLKLLFEDYMLPVLFKFVINPVRKLLGHVPAPRISKAPTITIVSNPLTKHTKPGAEQIEMGTVASATDKPAGVASGTTDAFATTPAAVDFKGPFLFFQGANALVALVYAFLLRDRDRSGWHQYQNFYGFLLNSAFLTFFISLVFEAAEITHQPSATSQQVPGEDDLPVRDIARTFLVIAVLILGSPFITHFVPGIVVYAWVLIIVACALAVFAYLLLQIGTLMGLDKNPKYEVFVKQTVLRVAIIFFFQTFYTYMVFYYAYAATDSKAGHPITGEHYLGVVSHEYNLRSQTWCNFQHALANGKNGLVFFSWL